MDATVAVTDTGIVIENCPATAHAINNYPRMPELWRVHITSGNIMTEPMQSCDVTDQQYAIGWYNNNWINAIAAIVSSRMPEQANRYKLLGVDLGDYIAGISELVLSKYWCPITDQVRASRAKSLMLFSILVSQEYRLDKQQRAFSKLHSELTNIINSATI